MSSRRSSPVHPRARGCSCLLVHFAVADAGIRPWGSGGTPPPPLPPSPARPLALTRWLLIDMRFTVSAPHCRVPGRATMLAMQRLKTSASIHARTRWTFGCTRGAFDTNCMPSSAHTNGARHKLKGEIRVHESVHWLHVSAHSAQDIKPGESPPFATGLRRVG